MKSGAIISECGRYRYRLDRDLENGKPGVVCWVMLNPSTADGEVDDPTLRRCIGFTESWGFGALVVVNLFAWRATDPSDLPDNILEAIGPKANEHITDAVSGASIVVCGWGATGPRQHVRARELNVLRLIKSCGQIPQALALTKSKQPRHPLYLRGALRPQPLADLVKT